MKHYIDVAYMNGNLFLNNKLIYYTPNEAQSMYNRTVEKFKDSTTQVIISLRDEDHVLISVFRNYK